MAAEGLKVTSAAISTMLRTLRLKKMSAADSRLRLIEAVMEAIGEKVSEDRNEDESDGDNVVKTKVMVLQRNRRD